MPKSKSPRVSSIPAPIAPLRGGGLRFIHRTPATPPEWAFWPLWRVVEPWQAVCLTLGLTPWPNASFGPERFPSAAVEKDFHDRYGLLMASEYSCARKLVDFATLANTLGWPPPDGFPKVLTVTPPAEQKEREGVPKSDIANLFEGVYYDSAEKWKKALEGYKWVQQHRIMKGKQGDKSHPSTWHPVSLASDLLEKGVPIRKLDAVFVSLPEWAEEWQQISESAR